MMKFFIQMIFIESGQLVPFLNSAEDYWSMNWNQMIDQTNIVSVNWHLEGDWKHSGIIGHLKHGSFLKLKFFFWRMFEYIWLSQTNKRSNWSCEKNVCLLWQAFFFWWFTALILVGQFCLFSQWCGRYFSEGVISHPESVTLCINQYWFSDRLETHFIPFCWQWQDHLSFFDADFARQW